MTGDKGKGPGWGGAFLLALAGMVLAQLGGWGRLLDGLLEGAMDWLRLLLSLAGLVLLPALIKGMPRLLRSARFGIVLLLLVTAASCLGTLVPARQGGEERYRRGFLEAQASFFWHLAHPLGLPDPPLDRGLAVAWLEEQGVARPEQQAARFLLGPDLDSQERIFGEAAGRRARRESREGLRRLALETRVAAHLAAARGFYLALYDLARGLGLTDIWRSGWFTALVGMLFLSLLLNLRRRSPFSPGGLGYLLAHGGVLLVILGGLAGRLHRLEGIVPLEKGRADDRVQLAGGREHRLSGRRMLLLDDFATLPRRRLELFLRVGDGLDGLLPAGRLWEDYRYEVKDIRTGVEVPLLAGGDGPRWRVRLRRILPRVEARTAWEGLAATHPEARALALLTLVRDEEERQVTLRAPRGGDQVLSLGEGRRLLFLSRPEKAAAQAWREGRGLDRYGTLRYRLDQGEWQEAPLVEGTAVTLAAGPGQEALKVRIHRVMQRFHLETWGGREGIFGDSLEGGGKEGEAPSSLAKNRTLEPVNPAAALVLEGGAGRDRYYAFAPGAGMMGGMLRSRRYPRFEAHIRYDELHCPAMERLILLLGPQGLERIRTREGKVLSVAPVAPGWAGEIGPFRVRLDRFHAAARERLALEELPDRGPFQEHTAAIEVEVEGPAGRKVLTLAAGTQEEAARRDGGPHATAWVDDHLALRFTHQWRMPRAWYSRVSHFRLDLPRVVFPGGEMAVLPVVEEEGWRVLQGALAKEEGAGKALAGFGSAPHRAQRLPELEDRLQEVLGTRRRAYWEERLPAGLLLDPAACAPPDRSCRVIRVNEPLFLPREGCPGWLGRYQVSQTDAEWDRPGYSGLGIVWDPGVGPARLGMVLMTLGTFLAFLARIRRRRREEEGA